MTDLVPADATPEQLDRRPDQEGEGEDATVRYWLKEWDAADKAEKTWRERVKRITERYREDDERKADDVGSRVNILWANTQILAPALYSATPKPDVRRRYRDADPLGKQVADILERGISYQIDDYDFDGTIEQAVLDLLLSGRGVVWLSHVVETAPGPDGEETLVEESVRCEAVHWDDIRISPARRWADVRWVGRKLYLTREQMEINFPDIGSKVPLSYDTMQREDRSDQPPDPWRRCEVYQIWDKERRQVVHLSPSWRAGLLSQEKDPLGLRDFLPMPDPLYSLTTGGTLVPVPEYLLYEDLALELDRVTERITRLIDGLRLRGGYDAGTMELGTIIDATDNKLVPIEEYSKWAEKGGLKALIDFVPIDPIAKVIAQLYQHRAQLVQQIAEMTGISDIIRGSTKAAETATAQEIKARYGGLRLNSRQQKVQRFVREIFRITAEIMAERFRPQTLERMTGIKITPEILNVLRRDTARSYRVDVETDSTIAQDQAEDTQALTGLLQGIVQYMQGIGPAVQSGIVPLDAAKNMLLAVMRRAKLGRTLEDSIDQIGQDANGQPVQMAQQGDPNAGAEQAKAQIGMQSIQAKAAADQARSQADMARAQHDREMLALEFQVKQAEHDLKMREMAMKAEIAERQHAMKMAEMMAPVGETMVVTQ